MQKTHFDSFHCNTNAECGNCAIAAENKSLRQLVEELQELIEDLQERIEKLEEKIEAVRVFVLNIYNQANQILSRRSGVPRGIWSYWKGAGEVARKVYNLLSEG